MGERLADVEVWAARGCWLWCTSPQSGISVWLPKMNLETAAARISLGCHRLGDVERQPTSDASPARYRNGRAPVDPHATRRDNRYDLLYTHTALCDGSGGMKMHSYFPVMMNGRDRDRQMIAPSHDCYTGLSPPWNEET